VVVQVRSEDVLSGSGVLPCLKFGIFYDNDDAVRLFQLMATALLVTFAGFVVV
jgi:hypothetical protein